MPRRGAIPFFTDHNVPESACRSLTEFGHKITRLRECMATDSKDPLVALACANAGQVLVTHDRDFRDLAKRLNITRKQYHNRLHRLQLMCDEPLSAQRLKECIKLVESEWKLAKQRSKPLVVELYNHFIRIYR